ncbi:hypothetical protein SDC9_77579 [bioreactor metagenome]|uniref:Uncharacterized protein n=1 Tax=bioreactor metagenome TaxID=1076179 RepID=A0A644YR82_9ZZZZ
MVQIAGHGVFPSAALAANQQRHIRKRHGGGLLDRGLQCLVKRGNPQFFGRGLTADPLGIFIHDTGHLAHLLIQLVESGHVLKNGDGPKKLRPIP